MTFVPGKRIGHYEILERVGAGGMGEVFRARDTRLARDVAIKVLGRAVLNSQESLRRFATEAKAASALNHPNIVTVHEIGEADLGPYIVTEFVEGDTVRTLLRQGSLPVDRALEVMLDACRGLAKAHEAGIFHRDIKPENLMVTRDGHAKILDFGLAKIVAPAEATLATTLAQAPALTASGAVIGTPAYLTPEQLEGRPADERSDLYMLGLVAYEMITGRNPFSRASLAETVKAILHDVPQPIGTAHPAVSPQLVRAIECCLERDPSRRPESARALLASLEHARDARTVTRLGARANAQRGGQRPRVAIAAVVVVIALLALAGTWMVHRSTVPGAPSPATPTTDPGFALTAGRKVVAVLPIHDNSGEAELASADIGAILADALVQIMADRREFYVASPVRLEAAAQTLGRPLGRAAGDPAFARRIGHEVAADLVLTGVLSRIGSTYHLSAMLTDLHTETVFGSFRAECSDRDSMLDELAADIAAGVETQFDVDGTARGRSVETVATPSVEAYAHFIRGMSYNYAGQWNEAVPELREAVAIDPGMGIAWTELACAYSFAGDEPRSTAAQRVAESLLARVNDRERMWIEMNGVWVNSGDGGAYMEAAKKFIAAFPDDREGYFYAGLGAEYLLDDCRQALTWYERAYRLTPIFYPITKGLVDCHLKLGERDQAKAALERYLELGAIGEHGRAQAGARLGSLES